jgi:hypothetical protein
VTNTHPWQSGPRELFQFAINAYNNGDDSGRRITFLLIDVCVETTLRTFLGLPVRISGSKIGYSDLKQFANGKFHDLTKGVERATSGKISDDVLHHLRFYHNIRNRLYHEGNGMTVPEEHVRGYGTLAANLLKELLGIDGEAMLPGTWKDESAKKSCALEEMRRDLEKEIERFEHAINSVMERSAPRMIYPSTVRKLKELSEFDITTFGAKLQSFRKLIEENLSDEKLRTWLLRFLAYDVSYDPPQVISNSQLIMALGKDPTAFYALLIGIQSLPIDDVSMDTLDNWDDISFIQQDDYSIMGVYESARFLLAMLNDKHWFGFSEVQLLERSEQLRSKLKSISPKIEGLRLSN